MRIRKIEIRNFRCIKSLTWNPSEGINCLVGPGDSGKSTILDAIDFCLGLRKSVQFTDSDFHKLDISEPIEIYATIGELDDHFKRIDGFGMYLRGFNVENSTVEDEPLKGCEVVLTIKLSIDSDLEPTWTLFSERTEALEQPRHLSWKERALLSPSRIGTVADHNLSWRKGSILNRISEDRADTSTALLKATRETRAKFGEEAKDQLKHSLNIVKETVTEMGIRGIDDITAMLDAQSVSFTGGTVSLHDKNGIPFRSLGTGSIRLLTAGLQRKAAVEEDASILIIDELELGLEPHRIIRLLNSLGSKEAVPPMQVFMTTHSPIVLTELSGDQLFILRKAVTGHIILPAGNSDEIQGTIRSHPSAFLATKVLVCEGASEVGLIRGFDHALIAEGRPAMSSKGLAIVDGGCVHESVRRALAFQKLGYKTAILRDDDVSPPTVLEDEFKANGGEIFVWQKGNSLEDELFLNLPDISIQALLDKAIELHGRELITEHIKSASKGTIDLDTCIQSKNVNTKKILSAASKSNRNPWFKSVSAMEEIARYIVFPGLKQATQPLKNSVILIIRWAWANAQ